MARDWIEVPGGRIKQWKDRQRPDPRRWRERRIHTREMRRQENRRLRRVVRELIRAGRFDELPERTPLSAGEWMMH